MAREITYGETFQTLQYAPGEAVEKFITDPQEVYGIFRRFVSITCQNAVMTDTEVSDHLQGNGVDVYGLPAGEQTKLLKGMFQQRIGEVQSAAIQNKTTVPVLINLIHPETRQSMRGIVTPQRPADPDMALALSQDSPRSVASAENASPEQPPAQEAKLAEVISLGNLATESVQPEKLSDEIILAKQILQQLTGGNQPLSVRELELRLGSSYQPQEIWSIVKELRAVGLAAVFTTGRKAKTKHLITVDSDVRQDLQAHSDAQLSDLLGTIFTTDAAPQVSHGSKT